MVFITFNWKVANPQVSRERRSGKYDCEVNEGEVVTLDSDSEPETEEDGLIYEF